MNTIFIVDGDGANQTAGKTAPVKAFIKRFVARFDLRDEDNVRKTFDGELNYECGRLFFLLFMTIFSWLPYIAIDLQIHQYPQMAVALRVGLTLLSIGLISLRFTGKFSQRPDILMKIVVGYLHFGAAVLTAMSTDEFASSYVGGYLFIMVIPTFAPFTMRYKLILTLSSFVLLFMLGFLAGKDFTNIQVSYSIVDIANAATLCMVLSFVLNGVRRRAWEQRQELKNMIVREQENIKTISVLARKAEAASKSKSNFLATMSHEIRTPMNAIIGIAQIQLQKGELPDEYAAALEKIYSSGNGLLGIINDILDLSKIETGKMELNPVSYDTPNMINDAVQLNIVRIGSRPIDFILDIDEKLPSRLYGDELRLKQVLNNLLSNAIKYTEKGYVKLSVRHSVHGEDIRLSFIVEDSGQGMRPRDTERLFSGYLRFNPQSNRATEGTGIGLNITKNLVDMMDGAIDVKSKYGEGTVFIVTVKQRAEECEPIGAEVAERLRSFTFIGNRQLTNLQVSHEPMPYGKVLVVDDVKTNLYVAEGLLLPYKLDIEMADSGFAAIDKVKSGKVYDIIFMDHMMPEMDGVEAVQKLRELGYSGAIVALTANALAGNDAMFRKNGFDGFISKPVDTHHLNTILNKFVRDRHPDEAKAMNQKPQPAAQSGNLRSMLIQAFRHDAEKTVAAMRKAFASYDVKALATTAHGIKTALANIGEQEMSDKALALEQAGHNGDVDFILANTEHFIERLENVAKGLNS
ncbi:MAG: response regulator [Chitinispirillales bacterium]|nr:response regulator [Chitinispirillales bacterium]